MLKKSWVALHILDAQKKVLKEDVLETIEVANRHVVIELRRHTHVHKMNDKNSAITHMVWWERNARAFKKRVKERETQDVKNVTNVRVN